MVTPESFHSFCHSLGDRVCPLYRVKRNRPFLVGTGVPFAIERFSFIITAAHVLDEIPGNRLVTFGSQKPVLIGGNSISYGYRRALSIDVDLAVVHLPNETAADMRMRFRFTHPNELGDIQPYEKLSFYALMGYPHSKNKPKPSSQESIEAKPLYIVLREFAEFGHLASGGKRDEVHVAFAAPRKHVRNVHFEPFTLPKPKGMSGGGLWHFKIDPAAGEFTQPRLVAIGIEHHQEEQMFLATRIRFAVPIVMDLVNDLKRGSC
jgi:hypothetical protein